MSRCHVFLGLRDRVSSLRRSHDVSGEGMGVAGLVVPVQAAVQASNHFDLGSYLDHYAY